MLNAMMLNATRCQNGTQGQADLIFVSVYALVFTAGLTLNLIALVVFFRHAKSRSHTTVYMTNLALADLLLVCTLPLRIYYHWGFPGLPQGLCEAAGLVLLANMYGSIFLLTCVSFDRCVAVCFPMSSRVREGRKRAPLVCLGIWALTVGASLPIYLSKKRSETAPSSQRAGEQQQQSLCFGSFPVYATQTLAVTSTLTVGFGVPLVIMLLCSWGLVRAIRRSTAAQTDLVDSRKIQRMIAANLAIFLCCFLPYHLTLALLHLHGNGSGEEGVPCSLMSAFRYSLMLACLNAMLDPLAYYFTTETFRKKVNTDAVHSRMWPLRGDSWDGNNRCHGPLNT